jgi:hypothetical protein
MLGSALSLKHRSAANTIRYLGFALAAVAIAHYCSAQDTPLISGGVGFFTSTNGGNTTYYPIIEPLLAAPLGQHVLVESRAALIETFAPNDGNQPGATTIPTSLGSPTCRVIMSPRATSPS